MKVRLLKVIVQPVFVLDDGESLREAPVQALEVGPEEWPTFAQGRFVEGFEQLQKQLDDEAKAAPDA